MQGVTHAFYPVYLALRVGLSLLSFRYFEMLARLWLLERFHTRQVRNTSADALADSVGSAGVFRLLISGNLAVLESRVDEIPNRAYSRLSIYRGSISSCLNGNSIH